MKQKIAAFIILAALSEKLAAEVYVMEHPLAMLRHLRLAYNVKCSASIGAANCEYMGLTSRRGSRSTLACSQRENRKTANVSGHILSTEMMENMEQNEPKKTKKTTAKTDPDMKKTGAAKSTKGAKLVDPTNTAAGKGAQEREG
ncbi:hypothetical protein PC119_g15540 [Phytophthora cactorum]|nr:hypothetical protein PC119_g15540 [Phytophthora cactorum]